VRSPQTPAMKCPDAREGFSALHRAGTTLTEWALVEAHLRQCAACRQEQARRWQVAAAPRVTRPAALLVLLREFLTAALTLAARASATMIQAVGRGITRSAKRTVRLRSLPAIPLKTSVRTVGVVLVLAFVLFTLQWTLGPRRDIPSAAAPGPRLEPTPAVSFLVQPPVTPAVEPTSAAPAAPRSDGPRQSPARASALSSQRAPAREAAREASPLPVPVRALKVSAAHIVGRLSAKDRSAAERDVTALLVGVGGSELGRTHGVTFTVVEVIMPQSRYNEFTRGLTRLGSWQLEAARSPLPAAVQMTIHVTE